MYLTSVHSIAVTLSNVIAQELNYDSIKRAKITYGMEILLGLIVKSVIFIMIPFCLGVLKQSLIVMFTIAFLRFASGGSHCKTFIGCLIASTIVYVSIGMLARVVIINDYLFYVLNIVSLLIIILKAPVDPPEKPIKTKHKRYIMKLISILILLLFIYITNNVTTNDVKNSILLGMYYQVITLTGLDKMIYMYINRLKLIAREVN